MRIVLVDVHASCDVCWFPIAAARGRRSRRVSVVRRTRSRDGVVSSRCRVRHRDCGMAVWLRSAGRCHIVVCCDVCVIRARIVGLVDRIWRVRVSVDAGLARIFDRAGRSCVGWRGVSDGSDWRGSRRGVWVRVRGVAPAIVSLRRGGGVFAVDERGAGVVLGAVFYAKETSSIKAYIDAKLQRFKPPKAAQPTLDEKESIVPGTGSI